jgi:hypothetical protein
VRARPHPYRIGVQALQKGAAMTGQVRSRSVAVFPAVLVAFLISGGIYFSGGSLVFSLTLLVTGFVVAALIDFA